MPEDVLLPSPDDMARAIHETAMERLVTPRHVAKARRHHRKPGRAAHLVKRCRLAVLWLLAGYEDRAARYRAWRTEQTRRQIAGRRIEVVEIHHEPPPRTPEPTKEQVRESRARHGYHPELDEAAPETEFLEVPVLVDGFNQEAAPELLCAPLYPARNDDRWPHLDEGQMGETGEFAFDINAVEALLPQGQPTPADQY